MITALNAADPQSHRLQATTGQSSRALPASPASTSCVIRAPSTSPRCRRTSLSTSVRSVIRPSTPGSSSARCISSGSSIVQTCTCSPPRGHVRTSPGVTTVQPSPRVRAPAGPWSAGGQPARQPAAGQQPVRQPPPAGAPRWRPGRRRSRRKRAAGGVARRSRAAPGRQARCSAIRRASGADRVVGLEVEVEAGVRERLEEVARAAGSARTHRSGRPAPRPGWRSPLRRSGRSPGRGRRRGRPATTPSDVDVHVGLQVAVPQFDGVGERGAGVLHAVQSGVVGPTPVGEGQPGRPASR